MMRDDYLRSRTHPLRGKALLQASLFLVYKQTPASLQPFFLLGCDRVYFEVLHQVLPPDISLQQEKEKNHGSTEVRCLIPGNRHVKFD